MQIVKKRRNNADHAADAGEDRNLRHVFSLRSPLSNQRDDPAVYSLNMAALAETWPL